MEGNLSTSAMSAMSGKILDKPPCVPFGHPPQSDPKKPQERRSQSSRQEASRLEAIAIRLEATTYSSNKKLRMSRCPCRSADLAPRAPSVARRGEQEVAQGHEARTPVWARPSVRASERHGGEERVYGFFPPERPVWVGRVYYGLVLFFQGALS